MAETEKQKSVQTYKSWIGVSSQVISTRYLPNQQEMIVEFKTGTYKYLKVPSKVWEASLDVQSIGSFINKNIKGIYEFIKLT